MNMLLFLSPRTLTPAAKGGILWMENEREGILPSTMTERGVFYGAV